MSLGICRYDGNLGREFGPFVVHVEGFGLVEHNVLYLTTELIIIVSSCLC